MLTQRHDGKRHTRHESKLTPIIHRVMDDQWQKGERERAKAKTEKTTTILYLASIQRYALGECEKGDDVGSFVIHKKKVLIINEREWNDFHNKAYKKRTTTKNNSSNSTEQECV